MRRPLLTVLLSLSLGATAQAADTPDYRNRVNIYNQTVATPVPFASFINVDAFKAHQECQAKGQGNCQSYVLTTPYSLDSETIRVGQDLRTAWQRYEDRFYWRAMVRLNNPAMKVTHCLVNWSGGQVQASAPAFTINTDQSMFPKELSGKIPVQAPRDHLKLDGYGLLPRVNNTDYCDNLSWDFSTMYLPGSCVYAYGKKVFCIEGRVPSLNPLAPAPLGFRFDRANQRILKAIKEAHGQYLADYVKDVAKALTPSAKFFPLLWSNLDGAVVAPTMSLRPNVTFLQPNAQEAGTRLGGIFQATAYPYYLQGLSGPSLALKAHTLPGRSDVLGVENPPGVWKLEEFKRRFPVNNPVMYERFGYTTLFQAWNELTPRLLPEDASAKPLRQMIFMAVGNNIYLPSPIPVPMPAPMLIPQYSAGLPYSGPQTHFTWISVPEGYAVPRVTGKPAVDYSEVTR